MLHNISSILSFYLNSGPADNAQAWMELTAAQRSTVKAQYAAAGISLMVSAFGSTDTPTSCGSFVYCPVYVSDVRD